MAIRLRLSTCLLGFVFATVCLPLHGETMYPVAYPGPTPGIAVAKAADGTFTLSNAVLSATWRVKDGALWPAEAADLLSPGSARATGRSLFSVVLGDGNTLAGREFRVEGEPAFEELKGDPGARRLAERSDGWRLNAKLRHPDGGVQARYSATLRNGSNYAIQRLTLLAPEGGLAVDEVVLVDLRTKGARVAGSTQGAPVVAGNLFFACEHPMAESRVTQSRVTCSLKRGGAIEPGPLTLSAVIGVVPAGQLRRGFLYYVERERAHPYRPFLHYNSWYDMAWGDRKFDEAQCLRAIEIFGEELIRKRGVTMDSFVFDDGWDDNATLWQFHDGFPKGFHPLRDKATAYSTAVGTWLSPFGGYGEARSQRLKYGKEQGFEINRGGFSLAGPKYYARFHAICEEMVRDYGVNFFKFDGMGTGGQASTEGGGEYLADIEALMRMVGELRETAPDLYVSATTGTWCSPYFLWHADSTWRGAGDMGFAGAGSKRQQWITYRDKHTYRNVVKPGPLYPLNSLMTQGIAQAVHGSASVLGSDLKEMADEFWSFFGSGTGLQELYIAPQLLDAAQWDLLADAARWARENADIFVDVHWVGADPGEGQVYGWAAWSPRKGILVLRNPSEAPREITIDIAQAFELPEGAPKKYQLTSPRSNTNADGAALLLNAGNAHTFKLDPFEVLVFDALPTP